MLFSDVLLESLNLCAITCENSGRIGLLAVGNRILNQNAFLYKSFCNALAGGFQFSGITLKGIAEILICRLQNRQRTA